MLWLLPIFFFFLNLPGRIALYPSDGILNASPIITVEWGKKGFYHPWSLKCVVYSNSDICMQRMYHSSYNEILKSLHVGSIHTHIHTNTRTL